MITYNRILAAGLLMGSSVAAMADGKFTLSPINIAQGETRTVTVSLRNDETIKGYGPIVIKLPKGLQFVDDSFKKTDNLKIDFNAVRDLSDSEKRTWKVMSVVNMNSVVAFEPFEEPTPIFTFQVKANDEWKAKGNIVISDASLTTMNNTDEKVLDYTGTEDFIASGKNVAQAEAYRMVYADDDIVISFDNDGKKKEQQIFLEANQESPEIHVFLKNTGNAEDNVALMQGSIVLPAGIHYVDNSGKVSERAITADPNEGYAMVSFSEVQQGGQNVINFIVGRTGGILRDNSGELFSFKVKAGAVADYTLPTSKMVIENISFSTPSGVGGAQKFPNKTLTINIDNPNQQKYAEIQGRVDDVVEALEKAKNEIPATFKEAAGYDETETKAAIEAAEQAVKNFKDAINENWQAANLDEWVEGTEDDELEQQAYEEIQKIAKAYVNDLFAVQKEIFEGNSDLNLRALTDEELYYAKYPAITAINDPVNGTFITAFNEFVNAYKAAEQGTDEDKKNLDLTPLLNAVNAIIEANGTYENAIAEAKGKYETELAEYNQLKSEYTKPAPEGDVANYAAIQEIVKEGGTYDQALKALNDKWEQAKKDSVAYDVDFDENEEQLKQVIDDYNAELEKATQALTDNKATYLEYAAKELPQLTGDQLWFRNYKKLTDINNQPDGEFAKAKDALDQKYAEVIAAHDLVNNDFAKETKAIDSLITEYEKAIAEAQERCDENVQKTEEALADYAASEIVWTADSATIWKSNSIDSLYKAAFSEVEPLGKHQILANELDKQKSHGNMAGTESVPNPVLNKTNQLEEAFKAVQKAINEAAEELASLNNLIDDEIPGLDTELTVNQIALAHVVNPSKVEGSNQVKWLDLQAYNELVAELGTLNDGIAETIAEWKEQFLNGEMTKAELDDNLATVKAEEDAIMKEAMKKIVQHIVKHERGDVGGDGRWTTNDYARIRRMILDKKEPAITSWSKTGTGDYTEIDIDAENPEDAYAFARYDVNRDGKINVGDATAALNFTFYGDEFSHNPTYQEARSMNNVQENVSATANGNVIAISLNNGRQYSAFQMDVVLPEGMTVTAETLGLRNEGFTLSSNEVDGVHRILVTSSQNKAFEGTEGDVLYLEVAGTGSVEFKNVIFADVDAATKTFEIEAATVGETTGISTVKGEGSVMGAIYNLGGRMVNGLKKGINIIRNASGETQKVIKK